jgi:DNA-binding NarL/FixJ family response regulator
LVKSVRISSVFEPKVELCGVLMTDQASTHGDRAIKVLVADDSDVIRRGIRQLLALQETIEVVGEAASYTQAIQMASMLRPRLVVLDLHMPDERHVSPEEVKTSLAQGSEVLAISVWNDKSAEDLAQSLGATILLDKADLANTLIPTIVRLCQEGRPT